MAMAMPRPAVTVRAMVAMTITTRISAIHVLVRVVSRGRSTVAWIGHHRRRRAMARVSSHGRRDHDGRRSHHHRRAVMMMTVPQRNAEADPRAGLRRSRKQRDCNYTREEYFLHTRE